MDNYVTAQNGSDANCCILHTAKNMNELIIGGIREILGQSQCFIPRRTELLLIAFIMLVHSA